jgi:hypothetical protein
MKNFSNMGWREDGEEFSPEPLLPLLRFLFFDGEGLLLDNVFAEVEDDDRLEPYFFVI